MLRRDRTVGDEKPVCKLKERSTRGKSIRRIKTTLEIFNIRAEEGLSVFASFIVVGKTGPGCICCHPWGRAAVAWPQRPRRLGHFHAASIFSGGHSFLLFIQILGNREKIPFLVALPVCWLWVSLVSPAAKPRGVPQRALPPANPPSGLMFVQFCFPPWSVAFPLYAKSMTSSINI